MAVFVIRALCLLLIVFIYHKNCLGLAVVSEETAQQRPSKDFTRHTLIKPRIYHGREKREIASTKIKDGGGHLHHVTVTYDLDGQNYTVDLSLNRDLLPRGYFHRYQIGGNEVVDRHSSTGETELCHYRGKVRDKPDSWAALSICEDDVEGVIFDGEEMLYIERDSMDDEHHYLYKHSDMGDMERRCGYEDGKLNDVLRYKRDLEPIIRGPYNSNKRSRYVELVLVVDNSLYKKFNSSLNKVERYCKDVTNIMNGLYSQLNIFIALVGVVTWSERNEIEFSSNADTTLTNFLHYRRRILAKEHPNDNAQLLSKTTYNYDVVGTALKGPICTYEFSGGINSYRSAIVGMVATTIAHSLGHNLGMEHDTDGCSCPDDRCVMASSSTFVTPKHWSNCSIESLDSAFEHGMDYCLRNKPESLFGDSVCGNGFVESGEQCDCGLPEHCDNTCCDPTTCLLKANASCATGECCNLQTCQIKTAGTMCRSADQECDLPEYCRGDSEYCPEDIHKGDGQLCKDGKAYCYRGNCRTRSDQCKLLWGSTGKSSDELCYKMNSRGNRHGNCGYDKFSETYKKCYADDVLCGMLHCKHLNERLEFGMESVAVLSNSFLNLKGSLIPCRTAIIDLGLDQIDPGLVPDGSKCGDDRMCVNQTCVPVETVRTRCPEDCYGHGVCNSLGECHCDVGFLPPSCQHSVATNFINDEPIADSKANDHPAKDFKRHTLIQPKIYHSRNKREISTTKNEDNSSHLQHVTVTYDLDGQSYVIDLNLNRDLLPEGYFHRYQENGSHVVHRPSAEEVELCHYKGKIRDKPDSWAAVSTCEDYVKGVIFDGTEMYYIEKNSVDDDHHYLYKHSDIAETGKRCGYEGDAVDHKHSDEDDKHQALNRILRYKRDIEPIIRGPYNANKRSRYVELVLVVDNMFYKELDSSRSSVERYCKDITNIINGIYSSLNIFIALVGVVTWTERNEIQFSENGDTTLTNFLHYRRENLIRTHPNDNAQLITKFTFNNGVVGKALKGPICTYQFSGGVNNNHSPVIGLVATTIAHEMGHNFGMEHDTNDCACPEDRCIMAPSSSSIAPKHWSNCSVEYLALAFEHGMDYCLRNKPKSLFGTSVCGNGFVEPGEQCDCGLPEHCDNTCCNATTCLLNANASCATGECCDLNTCKPRRAGTMCRSADIECDLPEYCTGHSEYCPPDVYKLDAEPCNGGKAYCYHGYCRTRSDQCKLLWGNTGKASDEQCYKMNSKGNRHGNCGYDKFSQIYKKCYDENVLCGMLHCKHLNERLEFGMESVAILSHSFLNLKGSIIPCRTAIVDLGLNQIDPGLAPDGAKCGEDKMCVNQTCLSVENLRAAGPRCPNNCNGNGVCNSLGHCHCKDSFGPPTCEYPGPGGSVDSGPASDPNARKEFVTAVFIIFLGIIPALALISLLLYYARQNLKLTWSQSPPTSKQISKSRGPPSFQPETLKRPTEDNHSLLTDEPTSPLKNEFFGHFKGFTISPKKMATEPSRPAPPIPVVPIAPPIIAVKSPNLNRSNTTCLGSASAKKICSGSASPKTNKAANRTSSVLVPSNSNSPPALPPLNNGANPRPIISSPILENSTCTAKELLSPLKNAPKIPARPAPELPTVFAIKETQRPLSAVDSTSVPTQEEPKKSQNGSALNRIASFLKPAEKKPQISPSSSNSSTTSKKLMDKNVLRTLEISNPILQNEIKTESKTVPLIPAENLPSAVVVMRAQSMRGTANTIRPQIPKFGSMRQANGAKRPMSIPSGSRPKSPPPPRPAAPEIVKDNNKKNLVLPKIPGFQKGFPDKNQNQYDDCLNGITADNKIGDARSPSSDNIYAVIEESPVNSSETTSPETVKTSTSGSSESFGLLGEIVNEIQNRNFDSIYSTSTLARKKKLDEQRKIEMMEKKDVSETYVNTSSIYKTPESVYSNMSNVKSSASSTSSGYIAPSAVNLPIKPMVDSVDKKIHSGDSPEKPKEVKPILSTFKAPANQKTFSATPNRNSAAFTSNKDGNKPTSEAAENTKNLKSNQPPAAANAKILERQVTPTKLRTRKPSPSRSNPSNTNPKPSAKTTSSGNNNNTNTANNKSNSPDLVTSCANSKKTNGPKPPDVLNGSMKRATSSGGAPTKPKTLPKNGGGVGATNNNNKTGKIAETKTGNSEVGKTSASVKFTKQQNGENANNTKVIASGVKLAARQHSNVASLQQKFENKPPISTKTVQTSVAAAVKK